ncbi:GFA family protein [Sphingomonas oligophenolica]
MEQKVTEARNMTGGCQCGRIRYSVAIADDDAYLCHCRMCQRATGGVSIAFKNVRKSDVIWEQEPDRYASSPIASRGYCSACGTPLTFEFPDSETMDLTVGSFDDPERFRPTHHFAVESWHEAWLDTRGLPTYRTDQNKNVVDRWMKTVGRLPD